METNVIWWIGLVSIIAFFVWITVWALRSDVNYWKYLKKENCGEDHNKYKVKTARGGVECYTCFKKRQTK